MAFFLIITTFTLTFLCYPLVKILQNYINARKVGLPILITPFAYLNPVSALTEPYLGPLLKLIPFGLTKFMDYSTRAWYFTDRYRLHARYGPVFLIVSPGPTRLIVADASATDDILARRKDFVKPKAIYGRLELFGPNVDTLNGEMWARHRRITTPPFNERNSSLVWKESLAQATGMLKSWMMIGKDGVTNVPNDTMALALHVLTAAGFGRRYEFGAGVEALREGHAMSYRDALRAVLRNLFGAIVTSALFMRLPEWMMPGKVREIKNAIMEFKEYMVEMVEEERASISKTSSERDNLMSVLLRASESEGEGKGRSALTDEEIFGNLFIYNLAGHDTTANTLAYAVTMLAADIKWQEWIGEEIRSVFSGKDSVENWEYEEAFPRLKRCLALMVS
jgi:cytochrome P450